MDIIKQLKVIFIALAAGQTGYFIITLILIEKELVTLNKDFSTVGGYIVPIIVIILVVASRLIYSRLIDSKTKGTSEEEKLQIYRSGSIIKFALLEGANFLSVTFYLITGDFLYAAMFVIIIGIFFANFPSREKFISEFGLASYEDERN